MRLRLESDDVLFLVQELASADIRYRGNSMEEALNNAHSAVIQYLGINIEFVVEGYDDLVHDPDLERRRQAIYAAEEAAAGIDQLHSI